jgi:hypothetical protein
MRTPAALCLALWLSAVQASGAPADRGLVAHYTFDEVQGTVLHDCSGAGHDGKVCGGAEWVKAGTATALRFDGADDYVEIPTTATLNVAQQGTLEVWYCPAAYQGGLACWHLGSGWLDERLVLAWFRGQGLEFYLSDGNYLNGTSWPALPLNQWQHVAVAWNESTARVFLNGLEIEQFDLGGPPDFGGAPLRLGQSCGLGAPQYCGLIGDVKIHSRVLAAAEVFRSYATTAPGRGAAIAAGTRTLKTRTRVLIEGKPRIVLNANLAEFRPLSKGMALTAEIQGAGLRQRLPLEAREWDYEVVFPAGRLHPGTYSLAVTVSDPSGQPLAPATILQIPWHELSARHTVAAAATASEADTLSLVRQGKPCATIVVPDQPDTWTQRAAQWLAQYLLESTGAGLPIVPESTAPAGNLVSVGTTRMLQQAGLTLEGLRYDGGRMVVRGNTLFLFGRDDLQFDREAPKGTCRTVMQFLEEGLGVRFFLPVPDGKLVPRVANLAVPRTLDHICNPAFGYAHGRYPYGINTPAGLANNFRTGIKIRSYGGHSYYAWLPAKQYFADHPEYFALIDGQRTGDGNHLCSSNPEVEKLLVAGIRKDFDAGYDWVQLGQEDGYERCQCPACEALDQFRGTVTAATPCERLLRLHRHIAEECRKSHPDKTVHLLVYGPTTWPSRQFDDWGPNVVAEMCNWSPEVVDAWKGKVRALSGYIYWFDTTVGAGMSVHATAAEMAEKIRYLHESGYVGLYHCISTNWGLQGPVYYILGKLLADPYLDYRELQKEYCLGLFGDQAGPTLDQFYNVLYAMPEVHAYVWPDEALARLEKLLARAETQAPSGAPQRWVKLVRNQFDFSTHLSRVLTAHRAYRQTPGPQSWAGLKKSVEDFEQYRDMILNYPEAEADAAFPGYDEFCRFLASKYVGYYDSYQAKRAEVLQKGVRGTPIGWTIGGGVAREPLGMDFSTPPPAAAGPP